MQKEFKVSQHRRPGDETEFTPVKDGSLRPTPITRLKGMVPRPETPLSLEDIDEAVAQTVARLRIGPDTSVDGTTRTIREVFG